jgi:hypothetical protein
MVQTDGSFFLRHILTKLSRRPSGIWLQTSTTIKTEVKEHLISDKFLSLLMSEETLSFQLFNLPTECIPKKHIQ